ncbi:hypothetical protein [Streptomyces sp. NPDC001966]
MAHRLRMAGYPGKAFDLTEQLFVTIHNAVPTFAGHIARHDPDFPELPTTVRTAWTTAAMAPQPTGIRAARWWRGRTGRTPAG